MAENDPEEKTEDKPKSKLAKGPDTSDLLGDDEDLMDLFSDAEDINEELAAITAGLPDIDMAELVAQARDIHEILAKR
ncbi:MAG: hypothetical protein J4N31_03545 [Chloroflexi bacterium]|nr:hypothetical protein [Pseudomonadota bacterium]MCI0778840.1 hypothetical protein [Chloroflexota bacterium]MCI0815518.1 hypothetical protein [Chloroflexota bacterium]MCI0821392.1 hypothetical protein [Chloroflexota bacterium]MCI0888525.1 hypothetical protein [Chloroflexota bacterium]